MKKYLGVKIVEAEFQEVPETFGFIGEHSEEREAYKVIYPDGYTSWSPKEVFEKAYKPIEDPESPDESFIALEVNVQTGEWEAITEEDCIEDCAQDSTENSKFFPFGTAIEELKLGKKVARAGWNGKGMFLFYISGNMYSQIGGWTFTNGRCDNYELCPFIAMKTADEKVVPWLASQTDMLAEDWQIVE